MCRVVRGPTRADLLHPELLRMKGIDLRVIGIPSIRSLNVLGPSADIERLLVSTVLGLDVCHRGINTCQQHQ